MSDQWQRPEDDEQKQEPSGWQSQWQQPQPPQQQPQWGQPQQQWGSNETPQWQQGWNQPPATPGSATASLILGICALVLCGPICAPLAIIYGNKAKREIDASGGRLTGRGMAQAGVVTGWISVGLMAAALLFFIILVVIGASTS